MSSVSRLGALLTIWALLATAPIAQAPLRVCADPNNMPFSNERGDGFENRIARLVARDLHRPVEYFWLPQRRGFIRNSLNAGRCDVVMGVPAQYGPLQPTKSYYRSAAISEVEAVGKTFSTPARWPALSAMPYRDRCYL